MRFIRKCIMAAGSLSGWDARGLGAALSLTTDGRQLLTVTDPPVSFDGGAALTLRDASGEP